MLARLLTLTFLAHLLILSQDEKPKRSFQPDISPDGKQVVFTSDRDEGLNIYVKNIDGTGLMKLSDSGLNVMPNWSPDGKQIAFIKKVNNNFEIHTMNSDGSNITPITQNNANSFAPKWSPDGRFIAYGSKKDVDTEIYVVTADGENEVKLTNNFVDDDRTEWSPDGRKIAYNSYEGNGTWNIYVMDIDNREITKITSSDGSSPAWSPDGSTILFDHNKNDKWNIHSIDVKSGKESKFLLKENVNFANAEWSSDGEFVVFQSDESGTNEIYIADKDGKNIRQLTESN